VSFPEILEEVQKLTLEQQRQLNRVLRESMEDALDLQAAIRADAEYKGDGIPLEQLKKEIGL